MDKVELRKLALTHACGMVKENESGKIYGYLADEVLAIAEKYYQFLIKDDKPTPNLKAV